LLDFGQQIQQQALIVAAIVGLIFSLLVCFLGLKAIRGLMALYGFVFGAVIGFVVAEFAGMTIVVSGVIGAIVGILLALIAFNLYIAVVFLGVWAAVAAAVIGIVGAANLLEGIALYAVGAVAGLIVALIVLKIAEIVIIIGSSILGGFAAAANIAYLLPIETKTMLLLVIGLVLSIAGLIVQFMAYGKKKKKKAREKEAVKHEIRTSKEAQVEEAMNMLDLDDVDDLAEIDDLDDFTDSEETNTES
jgi:hypothetical protein